MAAPDALGYRGAAGLNDRILGPIAASAACIALWEVTRSLRWINLPIGLWLLVSPWALGYEAVPLLNSTAAGLLSVAFSTVHGAPRQRFGGGWSTLWSQGDGDNTAGPEAPRGPQVVVITGASAGVGRAAVREFARRGARIGPIARGAAGLEAARREVEEAGGQALVFPIDVADAEAVERAAAAIEEAFGPIDIRVNNAMLSIFSPAMEMATEEFRRVTEVTYLGSVHGTLAALRRMRPRDRGVIVQVGSALAYRGIPLQSAYCAAKHAVEGFCDSLRSELIHDGCRVRLTMVQMPALNTPQFPWVKSRLEHEGQPVPPIFQPEVAARAIVWAAEHDRREILVGWPTVRAVWGNKFLPALGDWYLARKGYDAQ
jgi:NAD(P)-dependent dehydrogenase (short-subunit alcohol dehydrogenase family)